jgi:hypothetical protein
VPIHSLHAQSSATAATVHPTSRIGAASPGRPSPIGGSSPSISVLGKALAEAVQRAEKRDKESSPAELKALAERTGRNVFDGDWQRGGDIGGVERPKGSDAARAKFSDDVTAFVKRHASLSNPAQIEKENPLAGLDMTALSAIKYDESGAFTLSERRAAALEWNTQYFEWQKQVCARSASDTTEESISNTRKSVLDYLNDLPAIEKTFFAEGYLDRLHSLIASSEMPDSPIDVASPTMTSLLRWRGVAGQAPY